MTTNVVPISIVGNDVVDESSFDSSASRYKPVTRDQLMNLAPIEWLVKGVLPKQGLAMIYGPSRAGKSFLALDMFAAIAEGRDWFGLKVKQTPVLYVALEGEAGFQNRAQAWEMHNGRTLPNSIGLILQPFGLLTADDLLDISRVVPRGAAIVIDTLNRAAPGADENAPKDMGLILQASKELQRATGGLVVMIHHTGKNEKQGSRGHTSLPAAMDATVLVSRKGDQRSWTVEKCKDGKDGWGQDFTLKSMSLGTDGDGDEITSCAVVPSIGLSLVLGAKMPQGKHQIAIFQKIHELLKVAGAISGPALPTSYVAGTPALAISATIASLASALGCSSDKRTSNARAALEGLTAKRLIAVEGDWLWLP